MGGTALAGLTGIGVGGGVLFGGASVMPVLGKRAEGFGPVAAKAVQKVGGDVGKLGKNVWHYFGRGRHESGA